MSDPRETEQRLRSWLDANQLQRERLCIQLLPLFGNYSDVQPRRPKGGPDGARDIQAVYNGSIVVWGAVGFRNSANDSEGDKKWVTKKFSTDIESALVQNPNLRGFVFFTNVDLTPREVQILKTTATSKGITHVDVFYRERLRQMLDSTEGLGYRLQYLEIAMSQEEQISFITRLEAAREKELQELSRKQQEVDHKLHKLEFLNECLKPVHIVAIIATLNRPYEPEELGHFRLVIQIARVYQPSPWPVLSVGGRDWYPTCADKDKQVRLFGSKCLIWSENPHEIHKSRFESKRSLQTQVLQFSGRLYNKGPFVTVGEFDGSNFDIFLTPRLLDTIQTVLFIVNNYVLLELPRKMLVTAEQVGLRENNPPEWRDKLTDEEKAVEWKRLYIRSRDTENTSLPPPRRHASREINFSKLTPNKLSVPLERGNPVLESALMIIE